ncbi:hypothetical protein ACEPAF_4022 [Sanghuangporus sanghuang]
MAPSTGARVPVASLRHTGVDPSTRAGISVTAGLKIAPCLTPTTRTGVTVTPLGQTVMAMPAGTRAMAARFDTRATGMAPTTRARVTVTAGVSSSRLAWLLPREPESPCLESLAKTRMGLRPLKRGSLASISTTERLMQRRESDKQSSEQLRNLGRREHLLASL